jgi:hypothetical protein
MVGLPHHDAKMSLPVSTQYPIVPIVPVSTQYPTVPIVPVITCEYL